MRKFLVLAFSLVCCSLAFAAPTPNPIVCPTSLACNYDTGLCEMPAGQWSFDTGGAQEPFSGSQTMNVSKIWAYKQGSPPNQEYQLECTYQYGNHSYISIYTYVKNLVGDNWTFSGMGKQRGDCSTVTTPDTCAGQN
jgi:hypothetical protein